MNHPDIEYLNLGKYILENGVEREDRTGTGTLSSFGHQMRFDLSKGFPLLTTKKMPFRVIAEEAFWFLNGDTDLKTLLDKNVNIWNPDAYRWHKTNYPDSNLDYDSFIDSVRSGKISGDLGPIYGEQWRKWQPAELEYDYRWDDGSEQLTENTIDQIANVIEQIRANPNSRRLIVSAWNVGELDEMALPPCHILFQFYVSKGKLSCQLYQRSGDYFLGIPFNIASYSLITHIIAKMTNLEVGEFIHTLGDVHIYKNHIEQVKTQLKREPKPLPKLEVLTKHDDISDYTLNDIKLTGYDSHGTIKGKVSVGL